MNVNGVSGNVQTQYATKIAAPEGSAMEERKESAVKKASEVDAAQTAPAPAGTGKSVNLLA
jgi:hypothetical protein